MMPDPWDDPADVRAGCILILSLALVCVVLWALILWAVLL